MGEGDESIADFVSRRIGDEAMTRLAAPILGGIFGGAVEELSIASTFPQLVELERRHGSLMLGVLREQLARRGETVTRRKGLPGLAQELRALWKWLQREEVVAPSPFATFAEGVGVLTAAIAQSLPDGVLRLGAEVSRVVRIGERWRVELASSEPGTPRELTADAVLFASPAHRVAELVPDLALAGELRGIAYRSSAVVFLGFRRAAIEHPLDGLGFVVPRGEGSLLASTWVSSKWDGRSPEGKVLVRGFVGGGEGGLGVELEEAPLVAGVLAELRRFMGRMDEPELVRIYRYPRSNAQPLVGHAARVARIRGALAAHPGLEVAGAAYDGVGIPDCIRSAREVAARTVARLDRLGAA